jgi:hypothetical protein
VEVFRRDWFDCRYVESLKDDADTAGWAALPVPVKPTGGHKAYR